MLVEETVVAGRQPTKCRSRFRRQKLRKYVATTESNLFSLRTGRPEIAENDGMTDLCWATSVGSTPTGHSEERLRCRVAVRAEVFPDLPTFIGDSALITAENPTAKPNYG